MTLIDGFYDFIRLTVVGLDTAGSSNTDISVLETVEDFKIQKTIRMELVSQAFNR